MGLLDKILKTNKSGSKNKQIMPVLPKEIYEAATLELQDILAPSALKVSPKNLNLGDKITRTYFVISYPRYLSDNWFTPIINLDKIFDVAIHIHNINTEDILKKFQKKVAEVQSQINVRESKGLVRDPVLDTAYQDLEGLRDSLQQAQQKMFDVGLYITIYADTEKELSKIESEIKSMLESKLVYIKPALFQQDVGFNSVIPTGNDFLAIHQKLNSEPLSSLFPFVSFDLSSDKGILYGVNRHNSSLIIFDRFSLENYNSVTFAKSGSGKSYSTKLEILRTLMFDAEVIVIDPEREYEYLAEAIGGRYFNISLSSEHHINPFDLPIPTGDETPDDILRGNTIQLVGLFRIMLGGLSPEEDALIDKAITETYAMKDISAESDFSNIEPPLLSDFEMVLSGLEGSDSVVTRLLKYTQGTWKNFLNQPTNVDINRKFIVFSVRDMEDDLKPVAMYIITHFIWNAVRKNLKKRLLIVDEAWWMMKSEDTASFLYSIAKRGRKYYLGLSTITQDVNDFINSPYGMPIVTNSSMQILLKQSTSSADALQKVFNLTDEEKYLLLESEVGEGIFFAGLKHVAIKIIASYTEDQIITSDPSQILAIKKAKDEYMEEEDRSNNKPSPRDDSFKVNYEEEKVEKALESEDVDLKAPEVKASTPQEEPKKIRIISENMTEVGKMEDENNKLDAEIDELEKMFREQI
ncbi:MAG: conjugal transfer ATP-binding protein TraC [Patescibacteria group bacterium]|nr:conjugal transfer ATP-binding protein TraC [Patescibacteria group bacterium]